MVRSVTAVCLPRFSSSRASWVGVDESGVGDDVRRGGRRDDFAFLAQALLAGRGDRRLRVDVGFFYEGTMFVPELEAAAFPCSLASWSEVTPISNESSGTFLRPSGD